MSEEQANQKIWDAIRKNLLVEQELIDEWKGQSDGFGYATYEEYVDERIIKAMKAEAQEREKNGLKMFENMDEG